MYNLKNNVMKSKNRGSEKEPMSKKAFNRTFPLAGRHPFILMGFGGGNGWFGDGWVPGSGGPNWNDNVPPATNYTPEPDWWVGYGSPNNPIQLDTVTITPGSINSASAWANVGWTLAGVAEIVAGVAAIPANPFIGVYAVIDGFGRTGLNLANLINDLKGGNVPQLPSSFGGAIGMAWNNEEGAYYGALTNDIITAAVTGGVFQSAWDATVAIKNMQLIEGIANGTLVFANTAQAVIYIQDWLATHP
jgi:hypothetical protein